MKRTAIVKRCVFLIWLKKMNSCHYAYNQLFAYYMDEFEIYLRVC